MTATKTCRECKTEYPATTEYFGLSPKAGDRLKPYCHHCAPKVLEERRQRKNERSRAWAAANRDKARASVQRSYQRRRRDRLEYLRRYRAANKERLLEYSRTYRQRKGQASKDDER